MTRKFTTGTDEDVTDGDRLLDSMPEKIRQFIGVQPGEFQHEVHLNGAVVIHPRDPEGSDSSEPQQ